VNFALGAQTRIDAQEKHERGKFADLAAEAEEEVEDDGQRDGGEEPGRRGVGEEEGQVNLQGGPDSLLSGCPQATRGDP
jgi:hypothetical protein